ncbi:hypothetical protein OESDEN_22304 [Oesophagostomum dentatum]|uniref:Uncharacterized protein n=1 Tax=Oesophagostomum dentatum TaxID=61180 RepID=A0A0B1S4D4_OESDE|nr:hypothetical protein OESDEN_22304 [Oesophagostomum dentatum]
MPRNFTRCFHSLYITTIPSMQLQGAAYTLTKESLRMAKNMNVDVAFAEVLSDHVAPVADPFGAFEMRSIPHSQWKDHEGRPLIKVKGATKSFLQVTFLKKTLPDSKL